MTPQMGTGEAIHDPGPITVGIMKDISWPLSGAGSACTPPSNTNEEWFIWSSCTISTNVIRTGNVVVANFVTLTIESVGALDMDLAHLSLYIRSGGSVIIKNGGKIY